MSNAERQRRWRQRQREAKGGEIRCTQPMSNAERQRRWRQEARCEEACRSANKQEGVRRDGEPRETAMSNAERQRQWRQRRRESMNPTGLTVSLGRQSTPDVGRGISFRQMLIDGSRSPTMSGNLS